MDDKLIDNLIQSDEIISKTIEEGVKSMETSVDDILSSVMSISVGDPQKIEKEAINQAAKEAQNIKASLTGTFNTNLPTIPDIAKLEGAPREGMVSEQTLGSLTSVMTNLEDVLNGMKIPQATQIPQDTEVSQIETQQFNIDKISKLLDDFKTVSSFDWASKWLSNVEKIASEVSTIKDELNNLPEESKLSLGVDENSLSKVEEGIQKVKENVTTDLSFLAPETEEEEQSGTLGESFLDGFSKFYENIFSIPEKSETQAFAPEEFLGSLSNFEEGEMKAVQSGISQILPEEIGIFNQPELVESPFGIENVFGGLKSTFSSLFGGEEEEPEAPLALTETTEVRKFETPNPSEEEESGGISGFFSSIFGGEEEPQEIESELSLTQNEATALPIGEPQKERKSLAELFKMAYGGGKSVPEEELEEEPFDIVGASPIAGIKVKETLGQPPALIDDLIGLLPNEEVPPIRELPVPLATPSAEAKMPPILPQMPTTVPFSLEALTSGFLPKNSSNFTGIGEGIESATVNQKTITSTLVPPPTMTGIGIETPVESLFDFDMTGAGMPPMPPFMEAGVGAMPPQAIPMPTIPELGKAGIETPVESLFDFDMTGAGMPPMPPFMEAGVGAMPPQAIPMPKIPELGKAGIETPVESLFDFDMTGAGMPPMPPFMEAGVGAMPPPLTETLSSVNAPDLEAIEPVETFEDIMRNILKNRASSQNVPTSNSSIGANGAMMPPMPPSSKMKLESKESSAVPQTLSNISNESIPFGGELLSMPPTIKTEGALGAPPELSFSSLEMFKDMDLFKKIAMGGNAESLQNMPKPPNELMPFGSGMEDILIKNQSQKSPELSSAISKIQSSEMSATANMAVESQMMMGEVNLEPLSQKLSGSISNLGDAINSQGTAQAPTPPESTQFTVQAPVEQKAEPEQNTAKQGMGMSASSESSGISEAQARIIGRQIANEIKSSLAKLYS